MKNILTFLIIFMSTFMYSQTDSLAIIERQTYLDSKNPIEYQTKNETSSDAVEIDDCGTAFSTSSYGADNSGNCDGTSFWIWDFWNDLDCNEDTGDGDGADVSYSVENDIYYYFCPATTGNWEFTIEPSNCVGIDPSYGYQYAVFQGQSDSLHTLVDGGTVGMNILVNTTVTINVTNTTDCIYIQIDGFAGTECDYDITLENLTGDCVLPVELVQQGVYNEFQENIIYWITASETNSDYFQIESSRDGKNWRVLGYESGAGNTSQETLYNFVDSEYSKGINYYRIKQVDYDGEFEYFDIMSIDNKNNNDRKLIKTINLLNQEVDNNYKGIVIDIYDNGDKIKRYNKK